MMWILRTFPRAFTLLSLMLAVVSTQAAHLERSGEEPATRQANLRSFAAAPAEYNRNLQATSSWYCRLMVSHGASCTSSGLYFPALCGCGCVNSLWDCGPSVATATSAPSEAPTDAPTSSPTEAPTETPTSSPTETPTSSPTETPTSSPTETPTSSPTGTPTSSPTGTPTSSPTGTPTSSPGESITSTLTLTDSPTMAPTEEPTAAPTDEPTPAPTEEPTLPGRRPFPPGLERGCAPGTSFPSIYDPANPTVITGAQAAVQITERVPCVQIIEFVCLGCPVTLDYNLHRVRIVTAGQMGDSVDVLRSLQVVDTPRVG